MERDVGEREREREGGRESERGERGRENVSEVTTIKLVVFDVSRHLHTKKSQRSE